MAIFSQYFDNAVAQINTCKLWLNDALIRHTLEFGSPEVLSWLDSKMVFHSFQIDLRCLKSIKAFAVKTSLSHLIFAYITSSRKSLIFSTFADSQHVNSLINITTR